MTEEVRPNRSFRISPVDRVGRQISPLVVDAAERIGRRAIQHAEKLHIDPAIAANLLEEAAAAVTRAIERKGDSTEDRVRDLQAYLFRAFLRRINKTLKRQVLVENAVRFLFLNSRNSTDPRVELERKILVDELLTRDKPETCDMFYRHSYGLLWEDIAPFYGISAHAAESRFSQALKRIREMLGLKEKE